MHRHEAHHAPDREGGAITVALAGNANVGKSVIFNTLTGLHQHVGNWPGKTVRRAEGTFVHGGHTVNVVDLPGIYSLSTFSLEEQVTLEYVAEEQPDVIVNVVDASALERNLFLTLQLMELGRPMVVALNLVDVAEHRGIRIHRETLSRLLGAPVVATSAVKGTGIHELVEAVIETYEAKREAAPPLEFGAEVEDQIQRIQSALPGSLRHPRRWTAIKLLEGDQGSRGLLEDPSLMSSVEAAKAQLERVHGHDTAETITSERYAVASRIAGEAIRSTEAPSGVRHWLDDAASHPVVGYAVMVGVLLAAFYSVFGFGDWASAVIGGAFAALKAGYYSAAGSGAAQDFVWLGLVEGVAAGVSVAVPYIAPFFLVLSILEDSGYLARVAYLMDSAMHRIGLHGKAFIPVMLGFGCNVPAVLGASVMEMERERLVCAFVASLVPCAARSVVIMGLVAAYMGFGWAILLYAIDFALILLLGQLAFKAAPGEPVGLIMEMPSYKAPSPKVTLQRTWFRLKDFVFEALPIMVAGNLVVYLADAMGFLPVVSGWLSPVTVGWLGLPAAAGVVLIFGVLRKELTFVLLAAAMGSTDYASFLTPAQMFVFAFVVMVYVPCVSTIAVLVKEFGLKAATVISAIEVATAVLLGGVILRLMLLMGLG